MRIKFFFNEPTVSILFWILRFPLGNHLYFTQSQPAIHSRSVILTYQNLFLWQCLTIYMSYRIPVWISDFISILTISLL